MASIGSQATRRAHGRGHPSLAPQGGGGVTVLAHRIRLDPNNVQATWLERCAGTARFAYNWGLSQWQEEYSAGGKPSWQGLNKELNTTCGGGRHGLERLARSDDRPDHQQHAADPQTDQPRDLPIVAWLRRHVERDPPVRGLSGSRGEAAIPLASHDNLHGAGGGVGAGCLPADAQSRLASRGACAVGYCRGE